MSRSRRSNALLILLSLLSAVSTAAHGAGRVSLHGQVTDEAGAPLEGAEVVARSARSEHDRAAAQLAGEKPRAAARALTDARGAYRLDVGPGVYELIASADGRSPRRIELLPIAESFRLEPVALPDAAALRVRVLRSGEAAAAGVHVAVRADGSRRTTDWHPPLQRGRTDEFGVAVFAVERGRTVDVWAVAEDGSFFDQVPSDRVAEVTLRPGVEWTLQAQDPRGRPLPGVVVSLGHAHIAAGRTDEDGRLSLRLPATSPQHLVLTDADGRYLHTHISVDADILTLPDPVIVSGRAVASDSGKGVDGAWVWPANLPNHATPTGRAGGFRVVARPGVEWVKAVATGYAPGFEVLRRAPDEPIGDLGDLEVRLRPIARIVGRVVDSAGRGIADADLVAAARLTDAQRSRTRGRSGTLESAKSRSDGSFVIHHVDPEVTYELKARRAGFAASRKLVQTLRSPEVAEVELVMEPGIRAFGRVVDEHNEPVAGANVELVPPKRSIPPGLTVYREPTPHVHAGVSADDGTFVVPDLGVGTYRIDVTRAGFSPATIPGVEISRDLVVDHEADLGVIVMVPGVELEGRVVDTAGRPIAGAELAAQVQPNGRFRRSWSPDEQLRQTTGPDGAFRFADLIAEVPLDLEIQHPDYPGVRLENVQPPVAEPLRIVLERPAVVRGRVVDDTGSPVPGLTVSVRPDSRAPALRRAKASHGRTGETGEFEIPQAAAGRGTLEVGSDVWRVDPPQVLEIAPGSVIEGVEVRVTRAILLTGTITGPDGRPLAESRLTVTLRQSEEGSHSSSTRGLRTDRDGAFQLGNLEPGRWTVSVVHSDHGEARETVTITERGAHVDLELGGGRDVSGRVLTPAGEPAVGTTVGLYPEPNPDASQNSTSPRRVGVSPDGTFRIPGVQEGRYRLTADHPEFAQHGSEPFVIDSSPVPEQFIQLRRGAVIRGEVSGLEFEQLPGATVSAYSGVALGRQVPVRHDGTYEMKAMAPGIWYLTARAGDDERSAELLLDDGQLEARHDFDFGGFALEGRVLVNGDAANGASVHVDRVADLRDNRRTETNFEGEFRVGGLEPGPHFFQVFSGEGLRIQRTIEIPHPGRLEINLRTSSLEGTVRSTDGTPLPGARVVAEPQDGADPSDPGDLARQLGDRHQAVADADGRYRLRHLEEGVWELKASHDGFARSTTTLQTVQGSDQTAVDFALRPVQGLWLDLRPAPALPMPKRVVVAVMEPSGALHSVVGAAVGDEGSVHLSTLPEGTWRLALAAGATPEAAATVYFHATAPADRPTVPLQPGAMLRVSSPELDSAEGIQIATVTRSDGLVHLPILDGRLLPGWPILQNHRLILGLPAGTWTVEIPLPDGRMLQGAATVQPGETATVEVAQ